MPTKLKKQRKAQASHDDAVKAARAQAAANLNALNQKNEALQENYSGRHLDASLDHSILSMNSTSEYVDKYVPWPLPEHAEQHRPTEALGMRWGNEERTAQESVSESMLRRAASPGPNDSEGPVAGARSGNHAKSPAYFAWHPRNEFADVAAHDPIICAGESIHESSEIEAAPEMTEHLKNYQWWPVQEAYKRPVKQFTNPIVSSADAPSSSQWHSENEAAQATAAALAACGDGEDAPVAGVSTARAENTHPYFTWNPAENGSQEDIVVVPAPPPSNTGDLSEYMERYRRFASEESAPRVRHVARPTHTIVGSADAPSSSQWHSENEAAQATAAALAACGDGEDAPVAGVPTTSGGNTHPYFVWNPEAVAERIPEVRHSTTASSDEMSEYMERFRRYSAEEFGRRVKPVVAPSNPIVGSADAFSSSQWHSENEAAQATAAALAACGDGEDAPVAGVSTAREENTNPYFTWNPAVIEEMPQRTSRLSTSAEMTEYMERYRRFNADETIPRVRHVAKPTHTIIGSADVQSTAEWHSENEAKQTASAALAACGDGEDAPVAGVRSSHEDSTHPYFVWNPEAAREEPVPEARQSNLTASGEMTEYMERFRAFTAAETAPHVRHVEKPTHTIVGLPDAPSPVDWHSENEIAQATAASLAARGDVEDAPIAGVSTSRVENTRPYFVWNPEVARQEHAPEARQSNLSASGDMTEYMQRFRAFTVAETAPHVRHVPQLTHTITGSADAPSTAQWHSENEVAQAASAALAACGDGEDAPVAGAPTQPKDQGLHTNFVWDGPYPNERPQPANEPVSNSTEYRDNFMRYPTKEVVKATCPNHLRASIVANEGSEISVGSDSSQRWRTEYIERFCGKAADSNFSGNVAHRDNGGEEATSVNSSQSSRRSELVDSRGITHNMQRAPDAAVRNRPAFDDSTTDSSDTRLISITSVPGDQLSRGESARSADCDIEPNVVIDYGVSDECSEARSVSDRSDPPYYDEPVAANKTNMTSSMSGPLPVRFSSRFSTEHRDSFQQREALESSVNYGSKLRLCESQNVAASLALERPSTAPAPAPKKSFRGRTETQARFAWPDESWYHQNNVAVVKKKERAMSTGRLGMQRGHYQKTWWNENQQQNTAKRPERVNDRSEEPTVTSNSQKSYFTTDSLERGSGCVVADTPRKIRVAPPLANEAIHSTGSPNSVYDVNSSPPVMRDTVRRVSPTPSHKSSHLFPKQEVRPSIRDHFGSTADARIIPSTARPKGPYQYASTTNPVFTHPRYIRTSDRVNRRWGTETSSSFTWKNK